MFDKLRTIPTACAAIVHALQDDDAGVDAAMQASPDLRDMVHEHARRVKLTRGIGNLSRYRQRELTVHVHQGAKATGNVPLHVPPNVAELVATASRALDLSAAVGLRVLRMSGEVARLHFAGPMPSVEEVRICASRRLAVQAADPPFQLTSVGDNLRVHGRVLGGRFRVQRVVSADVDVMVRNNIHDLHQMMTRFPRARAVSLRACTVCGCGQAVYPSLAYFSGVVVWGNLRGLATMAPRLEELYVDCDLLDYPPAGMDKPPPPAFPCLRRVGVDTWDDVTLGDVTALAGGELEWARVHRYGFPSYTLTWERTARRLLMRGDILSPTRAAVALGEVDEIVCHVYDLTTTRLNSANGASDPEVDVAFRGFRGKVKIEVRDVQPLECAAAQRYFPDASAIEIVTAE